MTTLLAEAPGPHPAWFQNTAAEILRDRHPELYPEVLAATLALDPDNTEAESLEGIIVWAMERDRADDCDRLRERFPEFPEYMVAEPDEDEDEGEGDLQIDPIEVDPKDEPEFPPEVTRQLDQIWDEMEAIKSPTAQEIEEACKQNQTERLPGIARQFLQLDSRSYDYDALGHVIDHLNPKTIDGQVAEECRDMIGVNLPRAHIMLHAHVALARWAFQHGLMEEADTVKIHQKVAELVKNITPAPTPSDA